MYDLSVSATAGKSDLTVAVVGHCAAKLPALVEQQAAAIALGTTNAPLNVVVPEGRFLLVKPDAKPWVQAGGENWRLLGKDIVEALRQAKAASATVLVDGTLANPQALTEGLLLADYRYNDLRSGKEAKRAALAVRLPGHAAAVAAGIKVAAAQNLARELADGPGNVINPTTFAARAIKECRKLGLTVKVTSGGERLRKAGFPGLAQVGAAGSTEPALVEITYTPTKSPRKAVSKTRLALVGKGLTFDAGGISIKPSDKMWEMKADCSGAASVLGAMTWIAQTKPNLPITGYLVLAENLLDRHAQRPGDIYRARNGKTIHVDNTDAEGRLVLADVLTYAVEQGATHMINVATLTGACMVALGDRIGGLFSRHDDFAKLIRDAGQTAGEDFWQLPLHAEYRGMIDHPHADMNNTGGRYGGAITAALFLAEFVPEKTVWAHLDIAGPSIQTGGWRYYAKGMTGFSTRTLLKSIEKLAG